MITTMHLGPTYMGEDEVERRLAGVISGCLPRPALFASLLTAEVHVVRSEVVLDDGAASLELEVTRHRGRTTGVAYTSRPRVPADDAGSATSLSFQSVVRSLDAWLPLVLNPNTELELMIHPSDLALMRFVAG